MLTLRKAFLKGITSPSLIESWHHGKMNAKVLRKDESMTIQLLIGLGAIGLSRTFEGLDFLLYVIGALFLVSWAASPWSKPMAVFLRDCRGLDEHLHKPGLEGIDDLKRRAHAHLVSLARQVIDSEQCARMQDDGAARKRFSETFKLFKIFGLTEENWDPYFREAENQRAIARSLASVAPVVGHPVEL